MDKKLRIYSSLAAGFLGINAEAQVVYNDIFPDFKGKDGAALQIDLNLDGYLDLTIGHFYEEGQDTVRTVNMVAVVKELGCEIMGSATNYYFYPFALNLNDTIRYNDPSFNVSEIGTLNFAGNGQYGNWIGVQDRFLGVKITRSGKEVNGWIRLDVDSAAAYFVAKDYAFNSHTKELILAGEGLYLPIVQELAVKDSTDKGNASDWWISFRKSDFENELQEYRLMVVPLEKSYDFTLDMALQVADSGYLSITPAGKDVAMFLPENLNDMEGNPLELARFYRIYILSIPKNSSSMPPVLSTSNRAIGVLHIPSVPVSNIIAEDISDFGDGRDLRVSFKKAADESKVSQYWIYVVKEDSASHFDLNAAALVNPVIPEKVNKTGNDIIHTLNENSRDIDGDFIKENVPYKVFVASMADGKNATLHVLSGPSNTVVLQNKSSMDNPEHQKISLQFSEGMVYLKSDVPVEGQLMIYDNQGKLLGTYYLISQKAQKIEKLKPGIYFYYLNTGKKTISGKFTVLHSH